MCRTTLLLLVLCFGLHKLHAQITVDFNADFVEICAPGIVNFTDNSISTNTTIVQWEWTRDGAVFSTLQNPALFFNSPGSYDICLKVIDDLGNTDSLCLSNYITAFQSPTANFTVNNTIGCVDLSIDFTDLSTLGDAPLSDWFWDFGNGDTTSGINPTGVYNTPGTFDVTLIVTDTNGCSDALLQSNLITATPAVTAAIVHNVTQTQCGLPAAVTFTGLSNAPNATYVWSLGDNNVTTGQVITHNYTSTGCFSPTVTVNSGFCYATATIPSCINVSDTPVVNFSILDTAGCSLPFALQISNQSTGYTGLNWNFGDG
ncbi:MAG: PKD domain-containing protein, partial [Bacteroidota bacterium]